MDHTNKEGLLSEVRYLTFSTDLSTIYPDDLSNARPTPDLRRWLYRSSRLKPLPGGPQIAHLVSPYSWSRTRKNMTLSVACFATVFASVAASAYAPGQAQMQDEWGISKVAAASGITAFTMGFAVAPMATAPFSELRGRKPVFLVMGVLYVVCTVCCAVTESFGGYGPSNVRNT